MHVHGAVEPEEVEEAPPAVAHRKCVGGAKDVLLWNGEVLPL
jgi:hypothetical protein